MFTEKFTLGGFLPYQLSILSQSISTLIASEYENRFALSMTQWRVLVIICNHSGPIAAQDISEETMLDKMAISRAVKGLRSRALINMSAAPGDKRKHLLNPTELGLGIYTEIIPIARAYEQHLLSGLSESEQRNFSTILAKLLAHAKTIG